MEGVYSLHIQNRLAEEVKRVAENEKVSVSSLVASALEDYLVRKKKKALGEKVLEMAGKVRVSPDVYAEIEDGRVDDRP